MKFQKIYRFLDGVEKFVDSENFKIVWLVQFINFVVKYYHYPTLQICFSLGFKNVLNQLII